MKFNSIKYDSIEIKTSFNLSNNNDFIYKTPIDTNLDKKENINDNSNLEKDIWLLTRTKSFRKWFGDWVNPETNELRDNKKGLCDDNGEPLVFDLVDDININPLKENILGFNFKSNILNNNIYKSKTYYKDKYFINTDNLLEISDIKNWKEKFYLKLILYCYNIDINFLFDNMYFIINNKYYDKSDDIKSRVINKIKSDITNLFSDNAYGDGKDLMYYFSNFLINDNTVELNIEADKKELRIYLTKLAKYILNPSPNFNYNDYVNGMKNIIKLDGIKYKDINNEYEYLIFSSDNIRLIFNKKLSINNDTIYETYVPNYKKWMLQNQ